MAEKDAEEEKMFLAIAVAAISNGVGKKGPSSPGEGPSPSDTLSKNPAIEEVKMAVVDVAAVTPIAAAAENISSAAEEVDGKMMEIATDTVVDQDVDDKMSEKDSELPLSLPAQPAIITSTSSSAASSAEPSTSSSASSSNSFTSAEYDQIEQVSDKLFSKCFPRNNDFRLSFYACMS